MINFAIRRSTPAQVEAFRRSLGPVAEVLAESGWVMVPVDPDSTAYDVIHVEFRNARTGGAMFVSLDTMRPDGRHSGFIIAPRGWNQHGRVSCTANHGFRPIDPEAARRALVVAAALDDNDVLGWYSTSEPNAFRNGRTKWFVTIDA